MSNLNLELNVIENATFFYAKVKTPSLKYNSKELREYSVDILVDKATAKAWNKAFPKQKAKEIEYDDFVAKFGADSAIGTEEQFMIKLKKDAQFIDKTTKEVKPISDRYRPRAFLALENGELEDISFTRLVGNGSRGAALFEVTTNEYGTFAKFVGIRVDRLVEVSGGDATDKFKALGAVGNLAEAPAQATSAESQSEGTEPEHSPSDEWK